MCEQHTKWTLKVEWRGGHSQSIKREERVALCVFSCWWESGMWLSCGCDVRVVAREGGSCMWICRRGRDHSQLDGERAWWTSENFKQ